MPSADPSPEVRVSVVIAARDAERTLGATLEALAGQSFDGGYEVIVVDNGSNDATADVAERRGARVIRRERGEGPGSARNAGVAAAAGELIAFTDSDCEPDPGWLAAGVAAMTDVDMLQGRVEPTGPAGPFDRTLWVTWAWGLFETANLWVRRSLFLELGGFGAGLESDSAGAVGQSRSGAPFGEDVVFGWRAVRAGARTAFSDEALVRHEVVRRTGREWLEERKRDEMFPGLVKAVPELRRDTLFLRVFLNKRNAALALMLVSAPASLATGFAVVGIVPYLFRIARDWRTQGLRVARVLITGDFVSLGCTLRGSIRARTLVV